jgi:hypothetical protein
MYTTKQERTRFDIKRRYYVKLFFVVKYCCAMLMHCAVCYVLYVTL